MTPPVLAARRLTKRFPGVVALHDVSFDLQPGEIHAICGENGAGKSTLIKLLTGIHPHGSYEGELEMEGRAVAFRSTAEAQRAGIAVIYQELALAGDLSVAENIFLGNEPRRWGLVNASKMQQEARLLLSRFGVALDPETPCGRLGIGQKQLVEIVKALGRHSRVLILDEPTAALAEHEVQRLLHILRDLRAQGISCIYISHKLPEVFAIADRITVLRDGASVGTFATVNVNSDEIIRHMVGREIRDLFPLRDAVAQSEPALRVEGLTVADLRTGRAVLHDISLAVAPGEVLGIGGLMGAGRTEFLLHLIGAFGRRVSGDVWVGSKPLHAPNPRHALARGVALVSEDRRRYGLVLEQGSGFNLSLSSLSRVSRNGLVRSSIETQTNTGMANNLRVKAPALEAPAGRLSGGNQQKVVLGKVLLTDPQIILLDEPTRGIDIGAKQEIYALINTLTGSGKAVILVSSELPELMGMSDRILMLHEGSVAGEFRRGEATPEGLLAAAMGDSDFGLRRGA